MDENQRLVDPDAMDDIIHDTIADADVDLRAAIAGFLFGGTCEYSYELQKYVFIPNEDYQQQFD